MSESIDNQEPGAVQDKKDWTAEQLSMFPDLEGYSMTDDQLGLDLDLEPEEPLNARERLFVQLYVAGGLKGAPAAEKAGYKFPAVAASRLLKRKRIRAALAEEMADILADGRITKDGLLLKLAAIVHADIGELLRNLPDPNNITLRDLQGLPSEIAAAVRKVKVNSSEKETRYGTERYNTVDLELQDPKGAAELIARMLKYTSDNVDLTSGGKPLSGGSAVIYIPAEQKPAEEGELDG